MLVFYCSVLHSTPLLSPPLFKCPPPCARTLNDNDHETSDSHWQFEPYFSTTTTYASCLCILQHADFYCRGAQSSNPAHFLDQLNPDQDRASCLSFGQAESLQNNESPNNKSTQLFTHVTPVVLPVWYINSSINFKSCKSLGISTCFTNS